MSIMKRKETETDIQPLSIIELNDRIRIINHLLFAFHDVPLDSVNLEDIEKFNESISRIAFSSSSSSTDSPSPTSLSSSSTPSPTPPSTSPHITTPPLISTNPTESPSTKSSIYKIRGWTKLQLNQLLSSPFNTQGESNPFSKRIKQTTLLRNPHTLSITNPLTLIDEEKVIELSYLNSSIDYLHQILGISQKYSTIPTGEYIHSNIFEFCNTKNLPKSIQSCLDRQTHHSLYFTTDGSHNLRPYLPFKSRKHFFSTSSPSTTSSSSTSSVNNIKFQEKNIYQGNVTSAPFDPYHVPFSNLESSILFREITPLSSSAPKLPSIQQLVKLCSTQLFGRTPIDCIRFLEDYRQGLIDNQFNKELIFKPKSETFSFLKNQRKREIGGINRMKSNKQSIGKLLSTIKLSSSISTSGGNIIDVKIDPTGKSNKVLALSTVTPRESVLIDLDTDEQINLKYHDSSCAEGHFGIDAQEIMTCGHDGSIVIWDTSNGDILFNYTKRRDRALRIAVHTELPIVAGGFESSKSVIMINYKSFETKDLNECQNPSQNWPMGISELSFGHHTYNQYLLGALSSASESNDTQTAFCTLIDINRPESFTNFYKNHGEISNCSWNGKDCSLFMASSTDEIISVFDIRTPLTNSTAKTFNSGQKDINSLTWSPCGSYIVSCGSNNSGVVFDIRASGKPLHILKHDTGDCEVGFIIYHSTWTKQGNFLATCGDDCCVRIWDISLGDPLVKTLKNHRSTVNYVDISHDSQMILSGSDDGFINIYSQNQLFNE